MKLFWKVLSPEEDQKMRDNVGVEDLDLPKDAVEELMGDLRLSASLLPPSARKFREWDVGLLERWEDK